jgi:hypothetical protein
MSVQVDETRREVESLTFKTSAPEKSFAGLSDAAVLEAHVRDGVDARREIDYSRSAKSQITLHQD